MLRRCVVEDGNENIVVPTVVYRCRFRVANIGLHSINQQATLLAGKTNRWLHLSPAFDHHSDTFQEVTFSQYQCRVTDVNDSNAVAISQNAAHIRICKCLL